MLAVGRGDQQIPDGVGVCAILRSFMRTTRSNSRSPWITCVAAWPPMAVCTTVLTSLTLIP